ncbi:hypothetical protein HYFRA_00005918 [Hymenoscyphus fraxineus]|uniref:AA9 family lytic polysaccharide monooxygenase n=1 Tax=Hymenoscyphus fraxineus TaxID=746836 RepID=A0A9N9KZH1_9HELO|nr:hypothetical protein HYFRA_00005918 [Hymenoscyphus fraxineus]
MFIKYSLTALLVAAPFIEGYLFSQLIVDDKDVGGPFEYMRPNDDIANPTLARPLVAPDALSSNDLRCGKGGDKAAPDSKVFSVGATQRIGARLHDNQTFSNIGPVLIYMSRAPNDDVRSYDGSGDWFKIWHQGICIGGPRINENWCNFNVDAADFRIPETIPAGQYLVRFEQIALQNANKGNAEFNVGCMQLNISSLKEEQPTPLAKIPGIYKADEAGLNYDALSTLMAQYDLPGPPSWEPQEDDNAAPKFPSVPWNNA